MKIVDVRLLLIVVTLLMFVACGGSSNQNSAISKISEAVTNNNSSSNANPAVNAPVRGNKNSKIYHWQGCPEYNRIAPAHLVEFPNAAAAEAAGYRAALNCPKETGNGSSARTQTAQPPIAQPTANPRSVATPPNKVSNANGSVATSPNKPSNSNKVATSANVATSSNKASNSNKNVNTTSDATGTHSRVKVWVNTDSGIYECPGSALYGKTKKGEYMTQGAAQKKGLRPAGNKVCQ